MHVLAALLLLIGAVALLVYVQRAAQDVGGRSSANGKDIRVAIRRLMYGGDYTGHPAESIEDPRLAAAGIAVAIATMDKPFSPAEIAALSRVSREVFEVTEREALDIVSFGRWIAGEFLAQDLAVERLTKVVATQAGPEAGPDLVRMISEVATADGHSLGDQEMEALDSVRRVLGIG